MIVSALRRLASTIRSRNWPSDQRAPVPLRSGASVPWNFSSGKGPLWQRRQRPTCRLTTMLRPRSTSPFAPVSDWGRASPTTAYGRSCASVRASSAKLAIAAASAAAQTSAPQRSAEDFIGDRLEPVIRESGFERARGARRVQRADAGRALDLLDLTVRRPVDADNRDAVIGRYQTVTGVDEFGLAGAAAGKQLCHRGCANLGLGIRRERRLRHGARDRSVADDVDVRLQLGFEGGRVDRTPTGAGGGPRHLGDACRLLRRNDIGDIGLVPAEIGDERHCSDVDRGDLTAAR